MSKYDSMTDEQYFAAMDEFTAKYQAPVPKTIEVFDLIMRKELQRQFSLVRRRLKFGNVVTAI